MPVALTVIPAAADALHFEATIPDALANTHISACQKAAIAKVATSPAAFAIQPPTHSRLSGVSMVVFSL
jgi:hypothetical protein